MKGTKDLSKGKKHTPIQWAEVVSWIAFCESAGIIGALFTVQAIPTWYVTIIKPSFTPPGWVFGPVWVILYAVMGIAAYRISRLGIGRNEVRSAIFLFLGHLILNAIWSVIFFGWQNIPLGFVNIAAIWLTLILVIFRFEKLDHVSAYLLLPYLAWVSFAAVLNYHIWLLNP